MYTTVIFDFFGVFCPDITLEWFKKTVLDYDSKLTEFQAYCRHDYGTLARADFTASVAKLAGVTKAQLIAGVKAELRIDTKLVR